MVFGNFLAKKRSFVIAFVVILAAGLQIVAETFYVDASRPDDSGDGLSWSTAKRTIQAAVDLACDGDTVLVAPGFYAEGGRLSPNGSLPSRVVITNNIRLVSTAGPSNTFIVGKDTATGEAIRCAYVATGLVAGFTLTNGATLTSVTNMDGCGGGIYASAGGVVSNCIITGNSAEQGGGVFGGQAVDCLILGNIAPYGAGGFNATFRRCVIEGNAAAYRGGGAHDSILQDCVVRNNYAYAGAGIYRSSAENCVIANNSADRGGGAMYSRLSRCRILANTVNGAGGGLHTCTALCSFISGNWAGWEGGGARESTLINCTVVQNYGYPRGCGTSLGTIRNSIIYYNGSYGQPQQNYSFGTITYSCTTPLPAGEGNISAEPLLENEFRLTPNSPCINAGNNSDLVIHGISHDLDSNPRILAGTVDIGAHEFPYWELITGDGQRILAGGEPSVSLSTDFGCIPWGQEVTNVFYITNLWTTNIQIIAIVTNGPTPGAFKVLHFSPVVNVGTVGFLSVAFAPAAPGDFVATLVINSDSPRQAYELVVAGKAVKRQQHITFALRPTACAFETIGLSAECESGLPVTFAVAEGPGAVSDFTNLVFTGTGTVAVVAAQSGDDLWEAAPMVTNRISVALCTLYVDASRPDDSGDGLTWNTAKKNLHSALDLANRFPGVLVLVTNGMYEIGSELMVTNSTRLCSVGSPEQTIIKAINTNSAYGYRCVTVANTGSVVRGFTIMGGRGSYAGGGAYCAAGGLIDRCLIVSNTMFVTRWLDCFGAGVFVANGGQLRNSLVLGNRSSAYLASAAGGGIYCAAGGMVENCTVLANEAFANTYPVNPKGRGGGIYCEAGATVRNTIIYSNRCDHAESSNNYDGDPNSFFFCCLTPPIPTNGNISADPLFRSPDQGDFRLRATAAGFLQQSPCIDAGSNQSWMSSSLDLGGQPRMRNGTVDIGAYESPAVGELTIRDITVTKNPTNYTQIEFSAVVEGASPDTLWFSWDFNNDGLVDTEGPALFTVTNVFPSLGQTLLYLCVRNEAGQTDWFRKSVLVGPAVVHVSTSGAHVPPYADWSTAATNIQAALSYADADSLVLVSDGWYRVVAPIVITNAARVRSVNGPSVTVIDGGNVVRCLEIRHENVVFEGFTLTAGFATDGYGGGARLEGGMLVNCIVVSNRAHNTQYYGGSLGGGIFATQNATVRNCLVAYNTADPTGYDNSSSGGGIYCTGSATIENCTVVKNTAYGPQYGGPGGVCACQSARVVNSIVYYNIAQRSPSNAVAYDSAEFLHCCIPDPVPGTGNTTAEPSFVNPLAGDYRLVLYAPCLADCSACVNRGTNAPWMAGATDLDGNPRLSGSCVDIGAYEYVLGPLVCDFSLAPAAGSGWTATVFTAFAAGTNTESLWYEWDFDNNGFAELGGEALRIVTNYFPKGQEFTIRLTVQNSAGERATKVHSLSTRGAVYVAPSGTHCYPYSSWETAATDLVAAVNSAADGDTVWITNGWYGLTTQVRIARAVIVRSVAGPQSTVVDGNYTTRCFHLSHPKAVLEGVTVTRGYSVAGPDPTDGYGGGIFVAAGLVQNCIVISNRAYNHRFPPIYYTESRGGGIYCATGFIRNCFILFNAAEPAGGYQVGLGGGVYCESGAVVENCTIVGNSAAGVEYGGGGGIAYRPDAVIQNCIIYSNQAPAYPNWKCALFQTPTNEGIFFSCSDPLPPGVGNITNDPEFVNASLGDYRLGPTSPCRDAGNPDPFYNDPDGTRNDMGAYGGTWENRPLQAWSSYQLWQWEYFGGILLPESEPLADFDHDSYLNWQEFIAGTDPTDPTSRLAIDSHTFLDGSRWIFTWPSVSGRSYSIAASTNLGQLLHGQYQLLATNIPATPPENTYTAMIPGAVQTYYSRIIVSTNQ